MEVITTKVCTGCKEDLPRSAFSGSPTGGISGRCRPCFNEARRTPEFREIRKKWNTANKDKVRLSREKYVSSHKDKIRRDNQKYYQEHKDEIRTHKHNYRARKRNAFVETVRFVDIALRDGLQCYLCKQGKGEKLCLDHVIPLSKGGLHCKDNIKLAHLTCNNKKRARFLEELD